MAALYRALRDTLLSPSQLSSMDYEAMREFPLTTLEARGREVGGNLGDADLLEELEQEVCGEVPRTHHDAPGRKAEVTEDLTEEEERRKYGSRLGYSCGLGRSFQDPEAGEVYERR